MLNPESRLGMTSGTAYQPHEPVIWEFVDYDTRRRVLFEGPYEAYYDEEEGLDAAFKALLNVIDVLDEDSDIAKLIFSAEGKLVGRSSSPKDDITPIVHYPVFSSKEIGVDPKQIIKRAQLEELDRLHPNLDLVSERVTENRGKLVFKYTITGLPDPMRRLWNEAFAVKQLAGHPHVIPFGHFVVDDRSPGFLGFTMNYISGGSLDQLSETIMVKRSWLTDLMNTIDDLNMKHGIMHQDIALRNILFDKERDRLYLCDFGWVACTGSEDTRELDPNKNDAKMLVFSMHHLLTGDDQYFRRHPSFIDVRSVIDVKEWELAANIRLEPGVTVEALRTMLITWYQTRSSTNKTRKSEPPHGIELPKIPQIAMYDIVHGTRSQSRSIANNDLASVMQRRKYMRNELGPSEYIVNWERPSARALEIQKK